ncbi:MAG: type VI secretion system-associated FHA domain protein [Myxococcaceae bacterium]
MRPLVIRVLNQDTQKTDRYIYQNSPVHLGRGELNDLVLPYQYVSLWHAIVWFDDQTVQYADLGSTNGTTLAGVRLDKGARTHIAPDAELIIGALKVSVSRELPSTTSLPNFSAARQTLFEMRSAASEAPAGTVAFDRAASADAMPTAVTVLHDGPVGAFDPGSNNLAMTQYTIGPGPVPLVVPESFPRPNALPATPSRGAAVARPASDAVLQLVSQSSAPYLEFRHAWRTLLGTLTEGLRALPKADHAMALALVDSRFPGLMQEPEFGALVSSLGVESSAATATPSFSALPSVSVPKAHAGERGREDWPLLDRFLQTYAPGSPTIASPTQAEQFLESLAQLIEAASQAFLELRKGRDQFQREVGVPVSSANTPLQRARSVEEVLRHLLRNADTSGVRATEFTRGFAELMIHQVALLNGIREGGRSLAGHLVPSTRRTYPPWVQALLDILDRVFPARARLRRVQETLRALSEEEAQLNARLFGREFVQAYLSVASDSVDPHSEEVAR